LVTLDTGKRLTAVVEQTGERVGLGRRQRGGAQPVRRSAEEGGPHLLVLLQHPELGGLVAVRPRSPRAQGLGDRQVHGVRGGLGAQEVTGAGEEVVDVAGEIPVVPSHAPWWRVGWAGRL